MSYTVLARRYRSTTFDEVVGQGHIAQTIKKAIASDRVAHAYLFCGTRGTGKTSTARILAKALNCESSDRPTPEPCNKCASCLAIARGDDIDVIEIDAASNTGVDNIRELIENSQYRPARSRFKVYIIDEVHMLSKSAFNALLKTLEEPPSHVKFILATTEPEKVLPTILSRCQRYDFRNIPTREIAKHLEDICKKEKIKADEDALLLVAKAGAGSMRDALSLLDRLLSVGEPTLQVEMIEQMLGLPRTQVVFDLADAIGRGDVKGVLMQADAMVQSGLSVDTLIASLVEHLRNLLILRSCGRESDLVEVPGLALADLAKQADRFEAVVLVQDLAMLEELRRQARQSQAGRALLDATLVRMALSDQFASVSELLDRVSGIVPARSVPQKKKPELIEQEPPHRSTGFQPVTNTAENVHGQDARATPEAISPNVEDDDDLPRPGKVWEGPAVSLGALMKEHNAMSASPAAPNGAAPKPTGSNIEPVKTGDVSATWAALLQLLSSHGPGLHGLLSHGKFVGVEEGRAIVRYEKAHETIVKMLDRNGKKDLVRDAFCKLLQQTVGVKFEIIPEAETVVPTVASAPSVSSPPPITPRAPDPMPAPIVPAIRVTQELVDSLRADPLVRAIMDELGANIVKVEDTP